MGLDERASDTDTCELPLTSYTAREEQTQTLEKWVMNENILSMVSTALQLNVFSSRRFMYTWRGKSGGVAQQAEDNHTCQLKM